MVAPNQMESGDMETAREMIEREFREADLLDVRCEHGPCKCERERLKRAPDDAGGIWELPYQKRMYGWPTRVRP